MKLNASDAFLGSFLEAEGNTRSSVQGESRIDHMKAGSTAGSGIEQTTLISGLIR
ncbi:MAG: hypothetical protein KDC53_19835 [Saprospiraceae bacterium]|nr:hypothetical protein [Saprospiraceae bacterium]